MERRKERKDAKEVRLNFYEIIAYRVDKLFFSKEKVEKEEKAAITVAVITL